MINVKGIITNGKLQFIDRASGNVLLELDGPGGIISFTNGVLRVSAADQLVALAGGAQAGTPITTDVARFVTVASAADSAQLPVSLPGREITVTNAAAVNSMNVFGQTGDKINAGAANAAFAVAAGKTAIFSCAAAGQWHAVLSA